MWSTSGGFSVTSRLSSVERYDPEKNEWTLVAPMSVCRSTTGVGVIGGNVTSLVASVTSLVASVTSLVASVTLWVTSVTSWVTSVTSLVARVTD